MLTQPSMLKTKGRICYRGNRRQGGRPPEQAGDRGLGAGGKPNQEDRSTNRKTNDPKQQPSPFAPLPVGEGNGQGPYLPVGEGLVGDAHPALEEHLPTRLSSSAEGSPGRVAALWTDIGVLPGQKPTNQGAGSRLPSRLRCVVTKGSETADSRATTRGRPYLEAASQAAQGGSPAWHHWLLDQRNNGLRRRGGGGDDSLL